MRRCRAHLPDVREARGVQNSGGERHRLLMESPNAVDPGGAPVKGEFAENQKGGTDAQRGASGEKDGRAGADRA